MTDRLVQTIPQQELGHPSNKALEALYSYIATEASIQTLESRSSDDEDLRMRIKVARDSHLVFLGRLLPGATHFYNEIKTVFDRNSGEDISEDEIQGLKKSGFSEEQVQYILRLYKFYPPKDSPL